MGGGGPNAPASTGGTFMPIENKWVQCCDQPAMAISAWFAIVWIEKKAAELTAALPQTAPHLVELSLFIKTVRIFAFFILKRCLFIYDLEFDHDKDNSTKQ